MYVVSKWGLRAIPPVTLAFLRVSIGAAVLFGLVRIAYPRRSFTRRDWRGLAVLGVWVAVTMGTQFVGTDLTTAIEGSLITVFTPVLTLVLAFLFSAKNSPLETSLDGSRARGHALRPRRSVRTSGARRGQRGGNRISRRRERRAGGLHGVRKTVDPPVFGPRNCDVLDGVRGPTARGIGADRTRPHGRDDTNDFGDRPLVAAVLYLGVLSTAVAWYCWYKGIEVTDTGTVAVFFFAQPVVGAALGTVFLGESIGTEFLVGGLLMALGVYIVTTAW